MQFFQYGNEGYKSILDPRTKLLLLVVINIVILGTGFSGTDFILRIACSAVPFVLFLVINWGITRLIVLLTASITENIPAMLAGGGLDLLFAAIMYYVTALIMEKYLSV